MGLAPQNSSVIVICMYKCPVCCNWMCHWCVCRRKTLTIGVIASFSHINIKANRTHLRRYEITNLDLRIALERGCQEVHLGYDKYTEKSQLKLDNTTGSHNKQKTTDTRWTTPSLWCAFSSLSNCNSTKVTGQYNWEQTIHTCDLSTLVVWSSHREPQTTSWRDHFLESMDRAEV